ncbi:hypothetical protein [Tumebacillus lipolyticus]|uniref:Uncharacterized protein n=1 Tax=Tumebacillus lipolyticus TaxID=1280370 RepID=A0ABW5A024_9BACL
MQKSRFFPFERNRYFYGKLLTVRDFESEQTYFNDKRRLLNRLLFGTGVVAGLQVVKVDERSFSLQAGVGLDHLGREIVVSDPMTYNLSVVPGFVNNGEYTKQIYLCIAYDEKGKEPVHSIANTSVRKDEVNEYNRMFEGYKVFVREEAPGLSKFEHHNLAFTTSELFQGGGVHILHEVPRYVQAGGVFEAKVIVERALQTQRLLLEFELMTAGCDPLAGNKVTCEIPQGAKETRFEFTYQLRAHDSASHDATVAILRDNSKIEIGNEQVLANLPSIQNIEIGASSFRDRILEEYYARSLDKALEADSDSCLYLAKIYLQQAGAAFMIDHIETVPFGDHIYNHSLLTNLGLDQQAASVEHQLSAHPHFRVQAEAEKLPADEQPKFDVQYDPIKQEFYFKLGLPEGKRASGSKNAAGKNAPFKTAVGSTELMLSGGHRTGINPFSKGERIFYSEEIEHGLGTGDVLVQVGVEECDSLLNQGDVVYYGDQDVFFDSDYESYLPKHSVGVLVYPKKGTFRIGLKIYGATEMSKVCIRWWAIQAPEGSAASARPFRSEAASSEEDDV